MEYQNTDDAVRRDACERVKQIVKAIKAIKIKYYLIFSKISAKDKENYQKLERALEKISEEHNLNNLKVALMKEIDAKYSGENPEDMKQGEQQEPDSILLACYGAIDAQKDAISKGRIAQAIRCQEQLKIYIEQLDEAGCKEVLNYKREKFAELMQTREQLEEQEELWNNTMKEMYKIKHVRERNDVRKIIDETCKVENQPMIETEMGTAII